MSQPQEPTERIFLPTSSVLPALFAAGLAGAIIGIYAWWPYSVAGAIVAIIALVAWVKQAGRETAALPREQHTDTAPIPLTSAPPRD